LIALPPGRTYHGRGWGPANHRAPRGPAGGEDTSAACRQPQRNGERKIFRFPVVKIRSSNRLASMSLNSRLPARSPPGLNQSTGAAGANEAGGRDGVELVFAVRGRAAWPQVCRPAGAGPVLVPSRPVPFVVAFACSCPRGGHRLALPARHVRRHVCRGGRVGAPYVVGLWPGSECTDFWIGPRRSHARVHDGTGGM
jgi:hypothetical protein